jgi:hypothetical protein
MYRRQQEKHSHIVCPLGGFMPVGTGGLLSSAIFSPLVFSSTAAWLILNAPSVLARLASPFFMRNR